MNTLRPLGVTFTPKPGEAASQYTTSDLPIDSESILALVILMRGTAELLSGVLPSLQIGSVTNETTGSNVVLRPHRRKRNQCVMNRQQSTSISGKHDPNNLRGEGAHRALWHVHCTITMSRCSYVAGRPSTPSTSRIF
jgi:hypothetical protein